MKQLSEEKYNEMGETDWRPNWEHVTNLKRVQLGNEAFGRPKIKEMNNSVRWLRQSFQ